MLIPPRIRTLKCGCEFFGDSQKYQCAEGHILEQLPPGDLGLISTDMMLLDFVSGVARYTDIAQFLNVQCQKPNCTNRNEIYL